MKAPEFNLLLLNGWNGTTLMQVKMLKYISILKDCRKLKIFVRSGGISNFTKGTYQMVSDEIVGKLISINKSDANSKAESLLTSLESVQGYLPLS